VKVLVVGAGIAGESLALSLGRRGWDVTVVELAAGMRSGGQTIDLRGGSRSVLDSWGLLELCLQRLVPQEGITWVDAGGRRRAEMPVTAFGGRGFVSTEELPRAELAHVLHAAVPAGVRHVFGDTVTALDQTATGVRVEFENGVPESFDLVVGADGTHSRVRSLVFGPEVVQRRSLGLAHAWFTLDETAATPRLDGWFQVHNAPGSRVVGARPGRLGQQEIGLSWPAEGLPPRHDRAARAAHLHSVFAGVGWRAAELVDAAADAPDLATGTFEQIRMRTWHRGRVVLLGDSAWCASPLSGMGTALALHGAASLDRALQQHGLTSGAFEAHEQEMRPRVTAAQRMFPGRVASYAPRTRTGITAMTTTIRLSQTRLRAAASTREARPAPSVAAP
jgi:2-polyprenyl-6-methoxyphenol hydroxylase-like FAD-dependent oxidoreductase